MPYGRTAMPAGAVPRGVRGGGSVASGEGSRLLVTAVTASFVYERAALHLLRRAWVNLDLIWAGTLVLTAVAIAVR